MLTPLVFDNYQTKENNFPKLFVNNNYPGLIYKYILSNILHKSLVDLFSPNLLLSENR